MRAAPGLPVPAGETVALTPNSLHIMLTGLKQPLVAGQSFPLTLSFAHNPAVTVDVKVQPLGRAAATGDHGSGQTH
jgi:periplasmic copper chaperone A